MSELTSWDSGVEASVKGNPYFHLDNVGDKCRGFLVKKSLKLDDMKSKDGNEVWQRVYTISVPEGESYKAFSNQALIDVNGGELMDVYGRMPVDIDGKKVNIIAGMEDAPLGKLVGFKFTEQRKPVEKGHNGAKIVMGTIFPDFRADLVAKTNSTGGINQDGSVSPF